MQTVSFGKCALCSKPAVGAINTQTNGHPYTEAVWSPRCDEHNPYWNPKPDSGGLQTAAQEASAILSAMVNASDWPTFSSPAMRTRIEAAAQALRVALKAGQNQ